MLLRLLLLLSAAAGQLQQTIIRPTIAKVKPTITASLEEKVCMLVEEQAQQRQT